MQSSDLDDVCSVVGYTATRKLTAWFGGRVVYVPRVSCDPDHPLAVLLGAAAFRALVGEFGGEVLRVPCLESELRYTRDRRVAERLACGASLRDVAAEFGFSVRRAQQLRRQLAENRWLAYAAGAITAASGKVRYLTRGGDLAPALVTAALEKNLGTGEVSGGPPPSHTHASRASPP